MDCDFKNRVDRICAKTRHLPRLGVLVGSIGFMAAATRPTSMWPGRRLFDKIIQLAGGQYAYGRRGVRYPVVSLEGIYGSDPDVIVDLVPPAKLREIGRPAIRKDWDELKGLKAVKDYRVLIPAVILP